MGKVSKPSAEVLDIGVTFGTWAGLGETASIGFKIAESRGSSSLNRAKELQKLLFFLVDARIDVEIRIGRAAKKDSAGQIEFEQMKTSVIHATADSRSLSVRSDSYSGKLSFKTADLPMSALHKIVKQPGRIIAVRTGIAGGSDGGSDDDDLLPDGE